MNTIRHIIFSLSVILIVFSYGLSSYAVTNGFTIQGTVAYTKTGDIYIKLLDNEQFQRDMKGLDVPPQFVILVKIPLERGVNPGNQGVNVKKAAFSFTNIQAGTYAIECFQDVNGNGRLDIGMFGPAEPWGYYGKRPSFIPVFSEESFVLQNDLTNIVIEIK